MTLGDTKIATIGKMPVSLETNFEVVNSRLSDFECKSLFEPWLDQNEGTDRFNGYTGYNIKC